MDNTQRYYVEKALKRFLQLVESLECECDLYQGYECQLHSDKQLGEDALAQLDNKGD